MLNIEKITELEDFIKLMKKSFPETWKEFNILFQENNRLTASYNINKKKTTVEFGYYKDKLNFHIATLEVSTLKNESFVLEKKNKML